MIPLVCYSHTDYLDVLDVQRNALTCFDCPRYLCLNVPVCPAPFQRTLVYDETKKYSKRLEESLRQLTEPYILLFQDMDIILDVDCSTISEVAAFMESHGIDRVDLKVVDGSPQLHVREGLGLIRNTDVNGYIYNVNPSIWKRESLLDMLSKFDRCYRTIEGLDVQEYCLRFSVYCLHVSYSLQSAYFRVARWFVYLHITSAGKLIPRTENGLCPEIQSTYLQILESFQFKRGMKSQLYGYN